MADNNTRSCYAEYFSQVRIRGKPQAGQIVAFKKSVNSVKIPGGYAVIYEHRNGVVRFGILANPEDRLTGGTFTMKENDFLKLVV